MDQSPVCVTNAQEVRTNNRIRGLPNRRTAENQVIRKTPTRSVPNRSSERNHEPTYGGKNQW